MSLYTTDSCKRESYLTFSCTRRVVLIVVHVFVLAIVQVPVLIFVLVLKMSC